MSIFGHCLNLFLNNDDLVLSLCREITLRNHNEMTPQAHQALKDSKKSNSSSDCLMPDGGGGSISVGEVIQSVSWIMPT